MIDVILGLSCSVRLTGALLSTLILQISPSATPRNDVPSGSTSNELGEVLNALVILSQRPSPSTFHQSKRALRPESAIPPGGAGFACTSNCRDKDQTTPIGSRPLSVIGLIDRLAILSLKTCLICSALPLGLPIIANSDPSRDQKTGYLLGVNSSTSGVPESIVSPLIFATTKLYPLHRRSIDR